MAGDDNATLRKLLEQVGWRPEDLAGELNLLFALRGDNRRVHPKTPYKWLRGKVPHPPLPEMVVLVIADELGEDVAFGSVWPPTAKPSTVWLPATAGLATPWTHAGNLGVLTEWVRCMRRREFMAVSGAALAVPVWEWADAKPFGAAAMSRGNRVTPPVVEAIEQHVVVLRRLDDVRGGGADTLRYVGAQFDAVAELLTRGTYDAVLGKRLLIALGQIGQTGAWMAADAGRHGLAQRWFLTGLRAAHAAGERQLGLSIVGLMISHAVYRGKEQDALPLVAAADQGMRASSAGMRALTHGRVADAYAAVGDLSGFRRHRELALTRLAQRDRDDDPSWAYYVNKTELDALAGHSLVQLARRLPGAQAPRLLDEASGLLAARAGSAGPDCVYQRSAVWHGGWLALGHVQAGEMELALTSGRHAVGPLPQLASARCRDVLQDLRASVVETWPRERRAREFVADLDRALAPAA